MPAHILANCIPPWWRAVPRADAALCSQSRFFSLAITNPCTAEQLRTGGAGAELLSLTDHLSLNCTNPAIVNALLYVTAPSRTSRTRPVLPRATLASLG